MGLTVLEIEVANPANPEITERVEFLIDSGAVYSVAPTRVLEKLGIRPLSEQQFRLADGSKIFRKKGVAVFRQGERVGGADVIFGEEGDSNLLGSTTLEALGLSLDPLRRELKPLPMILAVARHWLPAELLIAKASHVPGRDWLLRTDDSRRLTTDD
jgi:clan AA aspartic protease